MKIYCTECKADIQARLTNGGEIYPHRRDLKKLAFYVCDKCKNFVGTHKRNPNAKTKNKKPPHPLGNIAGKELKKARSHIHALIDPIWQSGKVSRRSLYKLISEELGFSYHTALIENIDQARHVYRVSKNIINQINQGLTEYEKADSILHKEGL